jgi:hypothetical protein
MPDQMNINESQKIIQRESQIDIINRELDIKRERRFIEKILGNSWLQLTIMAIGAIVTFSLLAYRVQALEKKMDTYPSADWFNEKFLGLQRQIDWYAQQK